MKTKLFIVVLLFATGLALVSCTSSRNATGCKTSAGFVGYGRR